MFYLENHGAKHRMGSTKTRFLYTQLNEKKGNGKAAQWKCKKRVLCERMQSNLGGGTHVGY